MSHSIVTLYICDGRTSLGSNLSETLEHRLPTAENCLGRLGAGAGKSGMQKQNHAVSLLSWGVLLAELAAATMFSGCSGGNVAASMQAPPPAQVKVMPAALRTVQDTSEYVATIKSRNSATIQPQVEGQI